jgi:hypothetical protein
MYDNLISPGVTVDLTDESRYITNKTAVLPLIIVTTEEEKFINKRLGNAPYTMESNKVRKITSLTDSLTNFGAPKFYETNGKENLGDCRNEYGLVALNQFLTIGDNALTMRVDVDLNDELSHIKTKWQKRVDSAKTAFNKAITDELSILLGRVSATTGNASIPAPSKLEMSVFTGILRDVLNTHVYNCYSFDYSRKSGRNQFGDAFEAYNGTESIFANTTNKAIYKGICTYTASTLLNTYTATTAVSFTTLQSSVQLRAMLELIVNFDVENQYSYAGNGKLAAELDAIAHTMLNEPPTVTITKTHIANLAEQYLSTIANQFSETQFFAICTRLGENTSTIPGSDLALTLGNLKMMWSDLTAFNTKTDTAPTNTLWNIFTAQVTTSGRTLDTSDELNTKLTKIDTVKVINKYLTDTIYRNTVFNANQTNFTAVLFKNALENCTTKLSNDVTSLNTTDAVTITNIDVSTVNLFTQTIDANNNTTYTPITTPLKLTYTSLTTALTGLDNKQFTLTSGTNKIDINVSTATALISTTNTQQFKIKSSFSMIGDVNITITAKQNAAVAAVPATATTAEIAAVPASITIECALLPATTAVYDVQSDTAIATIKLAGFDGIINRLLNIEYDFYKLYEYLNKAFTAFASTEYFKQNPAVMNLPAADVTAADSSRRLEIISQIQKTINANDEIYSEAYDYNVILCPGFPEVADELLALSANKNNEVFAISDVPFNKSPSEAANWGGLTSDYNIDNRRFSSIGALTYYYPPMGRWTNIGGTGDVFCASSGLALYIFALNDKLSKPWFAPAGETRGDLTGLSIKEVGYVDGEVGKATSKFVAVKLNQTQRDNLYRVNINPIWHTYNNKIMIWGQKTSMTNFATTALDRINVVRLVMHIKHDLRLSLYPYVFEQNNDNTRAKIAAMVSNYLHDIRTSHGLYDYAVVCDKTNNTPDSIDQNKLIIEVAIKPEKSIEFIYAPIVIQQTSSK